MEFVPAALFPQRLGRKGAACFSYLGGNLDHIASFKYATSFQTIANSRVILVGYIKVYMLSKEFITQLTN